MFDKFLPEVYDNPQFQPCQPKISQNLRLKDGIVVDQSFTLHDDKFSYQEIEPQGCPDDLAYGFHEDDY